MTLDRGYSFERIDLISIFRYHLKSTGEFGLNGAECV